MYQRCALQSMAGTLTAQVVLGNLPEFVIDKGDEGIEDLAVSAPPPAEQFCDLTRRSLMQGCAPKRHARDPCAQETYIRLTTVNEMKTGTLTPKLVTACGDRRHPSEELLWGTRGTLRQQLAKKLSSPDPIGFSFFAFYNR